MTRYPRNASIALDWRSEEAGRLWPFAGRQVGIRRTGLENDKLRFLRSTGMTSRLGFLSFHLTFTTLHGTPLVPNRAQPVPDKAKETTPQRCEMNGTKVLPLINVLFIFKRTHPGTIQKRRSHAQVKYPGNEIYMKNTATPYSVASFPGPFNLLKSVIVPMLKKVSMNSILRIGL